MILSIFVLAMLVCFLLVRVTKISNRLRQLELRFDLLDQHLLKLARKPEDLRNESRPSLEESPAKAATEEPLHAGIRVPEEKIAPEPQPLKAPPRPVPAVEKAPAKTPPAPPPISPPQASLPPPPPPTPPTWRLPKLDWESIVGVKLFSWIAGVALLFAAIFFLRYSISQGWLTPPVQMAIGVLVGIGLLVLCELKAARKYSVTANAMDASAIAILFSTFYAARVLWHLIGAIPASILMVLITAVAVLLSIRRDSLFIALLGLVGGFATPALLSTGENKPIPLFSYILLLNAGLAWVATKKKWPLLTTLSLVFTALYQWGWVMKFLTAPQLPIALGIFLVFPILAFAAIAFGQKEQPEKGWISLYGQTANLSALLPLLFALYAAVVPGYGHRYILLFGFLFLLDSGLFAIAAVRGPAILHFIGGLSTVLICAIWMGFSYESSCWPGVLGFIILFSAFYLAAPLIAERFGHGITSIGKKAVYATPFLLFLFPALAATEPACAGPGLLFGALFLILIGASAYAIFEENGPIYFIAALFALLAEAVWAAKYLAPERVFSGLAVFGVFGLIYIGVPAAAGRWKRKLHPESAGAGLLLVSLVLLLFLAAGPIASTAIWGLALLLLILNAGLFWQGTVCRLPVFAIAGMVLSWMILGLLWASVSLAAILIPALVVMAGFALLVLAGNIWMQRQISGSDAGLLGNGIFLGLTGHVFLIAVAAQKSLSVPPWPFLGILLVLDLAVGAAALYDKRESLHRAAMAASALLLIIWTAAARIAPWPGVGILSSFALAIFAVAWIYLGKRKGIGRSPFSRTAVITVVLAQVVTLVAGIQPGSPGVGWLIAAHMILLAAVFGLEWFRGTYIFAVIAVLPTAIAVSSWLLQHSGHAFWHRQLLFASVIYLMFIAYPILLGRRCGRFLAPYLAAVLAGVPFFFQARHAIIHAGWGQAIGILPIVQALLMMLLLLRLLGIEPRGSRALGRLALVAGAGLAFITAAIPLQLEKEWITIGWALEGAALTWLYGKIPHKGLLYALSGLFAAVFVRLALNPSVLTYQPRGELRIWNWYLYAYLVSSAALIWGGRLCSRIRDSLVPPWQYLPNVLPAGGILLLFLLVNIEIADFYSAGPAITFNFTATLAQDMTYTLAWALFAVVLLIAGIAIRSQPARIASLALLVATILKCFLHDLARLGELYRVASLFGLAICLVLAALALQKYVLSARKEGK